MNVYLVADIEGVAGVVFYEHRHANMSLLNHELLHRNRVLLTEEVNAAARWPEKPNVCANFTKALMDSLCNVPWYKPVEKIDDGWRWPDRTQPTATPDDKWNLW